MTVPSIVGIGRWLPTKDCHKSESGQGAPLSGT